MRNNQIHIAVVNNSKIVEAAEVNADTNALLTTVQPVIVKAIAGGKYLLTEDENGTAPENITVKRVGHNLWICFEGEDLDHPGLIIENFYDYDGEVIGKGEDGSYHEYIASDARDEHEAAALLSGDSSALVLGSDNVVGVGALVAPVGMVSPVWMGLLGLLVAGGAVAALAGGGGGGGGGGDNSGGSDAGSSTGVTDEAAVAPVVVVPPATQITQVSDDAGAVHASVASGGLTDDNTPTLTGKSDPNVTIVIYDNGNKIGDAVTDSNGVWVFTPTTPLADGAHSFTSVATDASGNSGAPSAPWDVSIDATAPDAPFINAINDDVASTTGSIASGGVTDDNTPTLSGQGTPGDTITITDGGTPIGTAIVDGSGNWTFTPDTPLADGEHDLAVTATDPAGNVSAPSVAYPIIVDTTAEIEGAPLLTDDVGKVTGTIASGDTTDDNLPDYSGKTEPGAEVIIRDNGAEIGRVTADDAGNWSFTPETPLADGEHSFTAQPVDAAGNVGDESAPTDFIVDTVPLAVAIVNVTDDVSPITGDLTSGQATNDATPTLNGTATPGVTVNIYDGGTLLGTVVATLAGEWTLTPSASLAEGEHNFTATASSPAQGETDPTPVFAITIDTTPPDTPVTDINDDVGVTVGSVAPGGVTDDNLPTLSGTGTPGDTITITDGDTPLGTAIVDDTGAWTFTPDTPLADGEHDLAVTATDPAGNESAPSVAYPIIVDTTPEIEGVPLLTDDVGKVTGTIASGDTTDDNLPDYSGKTEPGAEVIIRDNGAEIGRVTADDAGNWSFTPETPLADGEHSFTAQPVGASGNVGDESAPTDFIVDTVPLAVAIVNVTDDVSPITGDLTSGQATNDATPTLNGTATPGMTVNIYDGGTLLGTVVATPAGEWTLTPSASLAEGEHNFTATAFSPAQGETDPTPVFAITIDTTPPDTPVTDINDDVGATVGSVAPGSVTDDNLPTLSGTGTPGDTITITDGGTPIGTAIVDDTGAWTFTPDTPLADGEHDLAVTATDPAGNESAPATVIPITIDTLAPDAPVITDVVDDVDALTGAVAEAGLTNDAQPAISGTAEANSTVTVYVDGNAVGTTTASDTGNWTFTPEMGVADGTHQITASAADAAGNISGLSNTWSVVVDTVSETPVITTATDDVAGILGNISNGGLTNDNLPVINGTAEHDSRVSIYIDSVMVGTVQADATGAWAYTLDNLLSDGEHQFSAVAVDAAGNTSSQSAAWGLTVDTVAPTSSILYASDDAGADSGLVYDGEASDDSRPTFIGNAEAGSNVTIFIDGVEAGTTIAGNKGTWSYTPTNDLEIGQHTVEVLATDAAGNSSEKTPVFTVSVAALEPLEAPLVENLTAASEAPATGVQTFPTQRVSSDPTAAEEKLSLNLTDHHDMNLSVNAETTQGNGAAEMQWSKGDMLSRADVLIPEQEFWQFDDAGTVQKGEASKPGEPQGTDNALPVADQHLSETSGDHYSALQPTGSDLALLLQQGGVIH